MHLHFLHSSLCCMLEYRHLRLLYLSSRFAHAACFLHVTLQAGFLLKMKGHLKWVRYGILPWYIHPSSMLVTTMSTPVEISDSYSSNLMLGVCIWRRDHCAQSLESGIWALTAEQEMSLVDCCCLWRTCKWHALNASLLGSVWKTSEKESQPPKLASLVQIADAIRDGAEGFFRTQYGSISKMAVVLAFTILGIYLFRKSTPEQEAAGLEK